jgi:hypothetical protein
MKIRFNETSGELHISKPLCVTFPVQNCIQQKGELLQLLLKHALERAIRKIQGN